MFNSALQKRDKADSAVQRLCKEYRGLAVELLGVLERWKKEQYEQRRWLESGQEVLKQLDTELTALTKGGKSDRHCEENSKE